MGRLIAAWHAVPLSEKLLAVLFPPLSIALFSAVYIILPN